MRLRSLRIACLSAICLSAACWLPGISRAQQTIASEKEFGVEGVHTQLQTTRNGLVEFGNLLQELRAGENQHEAALLQVAHRLAQQGRTDALDVARFYLALPPGARQRGLAAEQKFFEIRAQVQDAEELRGEAWREVREDVRIDLLALIASQSDDPDKTPAARAHALLARLAVSRLDRDGSVVRDVAVQLASQANEHALAGIQIFQRAGQRTPQLEPIWLLAELNRLRGQSVVARTYYQDLARLAAFTHRADYEVHALRGLVCLARESGDAPRVGRHLQTWAKLQTPQASWELAREQALWLLGEDQAQAALSFLWDCKPTRTEQALQWKALSCAALRRRGHLSAARRTLDSMRIEHADEHELLTLTEALQLQAEGFHSRAEDLLHAEDPFEGWSARGRVQARTLLGDLLLAQDQASRALSPLRQALREAQSWESRRLGPGSVSGEWLGLHAVVLAAQAAAESNDAVLAATLLEENQARHLGRDLRDSLGMTSASSSLRKTLQSQRSQGAGVITFAFGSEFGLSVHLGPKGQSHTRRIEVSRGRMQLAVLRLRQAIAQGDEERARMLAAQLSSLLAEGIGPWAHNADAAPQKLRMLLHGPLEELPVSALRYGPIALAEAFELVCNNTLWSESGAADENALNGSTLNWSTLNWRFLGAPHSTAYPELPFARIELPDLARARPGSALSTGADFTQEAMHAALTGRDALHLATHLVISPTCEDPELQAHGLLLAGDQVLCASTIRDWAPRLPLVFLGACASGSGVRVDGEGQLGLARALQAGGTRNLVVTLWPVSDEGSSAFAKAFHAAILNGLPPSQATAQACIALRQTGHPMREWAGFVHLGMD
ncbi:MAG: CHAT domain-containing protein [Glaciecola sp.]|jgi:CHAT domain-containing protein